MNFMVLNSSGLSTAMGGGKSSGLPSARVGGGKRSSHRWGGAAVFLPLGWGGSIAVFPPLWAVGI